MSKEKVNVLIEGGKATTSPAMGQQLGPLKVDIQAILAEINKRTSDFKGMKVPVKIIVDTKTKEFELEIGTPPTSELIKKELSLEKGSDKANMNKLGNLAIEQVIKIAKMKQESLLVNNLKSAVKSIIGSCGVMGILVEGKEPKEINSEIDSGKYDKEIKSLKIEITEEKKQQLKNQLESVKVALQKELAELEKEMKQEVKEVKKEEVKAETKEEAKVEDKKEEIKDKKEEKEKKEVKKK